ncbi:MAG: TIGR02757 family protein [Spirochaetales bacterium]|uniref:TIGR02757 family protein n=1 Tax=Candidatus Thalassospirochaeta sargassi TaxID=3119039 RepID=A0AAJ1IEA4_9SPIO|nr:TIGR02757 family protein [Spirochaetales bacterium]
MKHPAQRVLDENYSLYHKAEYIDPDPLLFPRRYSNPLDVEAAAFIAAAFALGRVNLIITFLERIFGALGPDGPHKGLTDRTDLELAELFADFKYRFYSSYDIIHFMQGLRRLYLDYGSIEACFVNGRRAAGTKGLPEHPSLAGLAAVADAVNREGSNRNVVSNPRGGSACKRLFLFLRWVVRCDEIDPGIWTLPLSELIIPLDTHVMRVSRYLGLTDRKSADFKTAMEITENLKLIDKEDPVRYDFSMSRIGIHPDLDYSDLGKHKEM